MHALIFVPEVGRILRHGGAHGPLEARALDRPLPRPFGFRTHTGRAPVAIALAKAASAEAVTVEVGPAEVEPEPTFSTSTHKSCAAAAIKDSRRPGERPEETELEALARGAEV